MRNTPSDSRQTSTLTRLRKSTSTAALAPPRPQLRLPRRTLFLPLRSPSPRRSPSPIPTFWPLRRRLPCTFRSFLVRSRSMMSQHRRRHVLPVGARANTSIVRSSLRHSHTSDGQSLCVPRIVSTHEWGFSHHDSPLVLRHPTSEEYPRCRTLYLLPYRLRRVGP